jgi:hypothetical protein
MNAALRPPLSRARRHDHPGGEGMMKATSSAVVALVASLMVFEARRACADVIELADGRFVQGDVQGGASTDESLALRVFDTGGTVLLRWDHIEESRRRELRRTLGIDVEEAPVVLVDGHRVTLVTGETITGVAENPRGTEPLRMKTRAGVREYDRSTFAGEVEAVRIDGRLVYAPEEFYVLLRDAEPPRTTAANEELAKKCLTIGAYVHAKEHLDVCAADVVFMAGPEGRAVETMLRSCDVGLKSQRAQELVQAIRLAEFENRWNDARRTAKELDATYTDASVRSLLSFDAVFAGVEKGRDAYFRGRIAFDVIKIMDRLVEAKVRERKPAVAVAAPKSGAPAPGTLAAARRWAMQDLVAALWDKVGKELGLERQEVDDYWTTRSRRAPHRATYGTGSFIVVKDAASSPPAPTKPPGAAGAGATTNRRSDEDWWAAVGTDDRRSWLTADFVERSNRFDVRAEQTNCADCGGTGFVGAGGAPADRHVCVTCNGCGRVRTVTFR